MTCTSVETGIVISLSSLSSVSTMPSVYTILMRCATVRNCGKLFADDGFERRPFPYFRPSVLHRCRPLEEQKVSGRHFLGIRLFRAYFRSAAAVSVLHFVEILLSGIPGGRWMNRRVYCESRHQPSVLVRIHLPHLHLGSRPLVSPICQPFIDKKESVTFPQQTFDAIFSSSTEEEQGTFIKRIKMINALY